MSDIAARVARIIVATVEVAPGKVTPDAMLIDDLGADSLDVVEVVMALEEEFGIDIPDTDMDNVRTVADVNAVVARMVGGVAA